MSSRSLETVEYNIIDPNGDPIFEEKVLEAELLDEPTDLGLDEAGDTQSLDLVGMYLREIRQYSLIDREKEIELGTKIQLGIQSRQAVQGSEESVFTAVELFQFQDDILAGKSAHEEMVKSNLRLVVSIAKKYRNSGVPFLDLIAVGNDGLIEAANRFDPKRGIKFSTFAYTWIRQRITHTIERLSDIPCHLYQSHGRILKYQREEEARTGESPSEEEIQAHFGYTKKQIGTIMLANRFAHPLYLDGPTKNDEDLVLGDSIADPKGVDFNHNVHRSELQSTFEEMFRERDENGNTVFSPREVDILKRRFGWKDGEERTLEQIGKLYGLSRERIRQIEEEARQKLLEPKRAAILRSFLDEEREKTSHSINLTNGS